MIRISTISFTLAAGALAVGCSSSTPQVVSGRVERAGFPAQVDAVRVVRSGSAVVESTVASDGSFSLTIPPGKGYRIELVSSGQPGLVFPRQTGVIDAAFTIRNGTKPFDLGMVRFVGDAATRTYKQGPATGGDDVECEDGVDPNGAVCVDDDDEEGATCESDGGADCVDGIDSATGQECDGGPTANQNDGETDDGESDDGALPGQAAVADHNLPAAIGCSDGEEGDD